MFEQNEYSKKILEILLKSPLRYGKLKRFLGIKGKENISCFNKVLLELQIRSEIYYDGINYMQFPSQYQVVHIESLGGGVKTIITSFF